MAHYFLMSTGFIAVADEAGQVGLAGTCACYQQRHLLVTAAHCVPDGIREAAVWLPGEGTRPILEVVRHPTSDLALLIAGKRETEPMATQVFTGVDSTLQEGGDFWAFGYPVEGVDTPVGRFFKGHFQRHFGYQDSAGREYFAGELSIAAPGGLSGGPVVRPHSPQLLAAVVTTNVKTTRSEVRRVVAYAIAAMLSSAGEWLAEAAGASKGMDKP